MQYKDFKNISGFLARIVFVNSSAGGKATEMNRVDGFAIQNIPPDLLIPDIQRRESAAASARPNIHSPLADGDYTFKKNQNINLLQFGNPSFITVKIFTEATKQYATIFDHESKEIYHKIHVCRSDNGLFFGIPESHVNEADIRMRLKFKSFDVWLNAQFKDHPNKTALVKLCKTPHIIHEGRSTNTGANYQHVSEVICNHLHKGNREEAKNDIWISTQREQQGARASCPNQLKYGFAKALYLNPDASDKCDLMTEQHLLMALFNLLKEFLNHIRYDMQQKKYSHPLLIDPDTFQHYIDFLDALLRSQKCEPQDGEAFTHKELLDFINNIWGQLELHVPHNGMSHGQAFAWTYKPEFTLWVQNKRREKTETMNLDPAILKY
jgi:hypothetical protein